MRFGKDTFANITTGVKTNSHRGLQATARGIRHLKEKVAANLRGIRNKLHKVG